MEGDFVHIADVGKLFEVNNSLIHMMKERAKTVNLRFEEVPAEYVSLAENPLEQNPINMVQFAARNEIPEMSLNVINQILYKAANEHDDINEDLRKLFTKVILYYSVDIQEKREKLSQIANAKNERRDQTINRNTIKEEEAKKRSTAFRKKIAEAEELLATRKRKFIRSFNRALELAKTPENLSESDFAVYRFLEPLDWVGFDGSIYCCKEQFIMDDNYHDTATIFKEILNILRQA